MAVLDLGRLRPWREGARQLKPGKLAPLYAAGLIAGAALGIGVATFAHSGETATTTSDATFNERPQITYPGSPLIQNPSRINPADTSLPGNDTPFGFAWNAPLETPADTSAWAALLEAQLAAPAAPPAAAPAVAAPVEAAPAAPALEAPSQSLPQQPPAAPPAEPAAPPAPAPAPPAPVAEAKPNFYVPAVNGGGMTDLEYRLFEGINAERAAAGQALLAYDAGLSIVARTRSQQMADQGYFGHVDPYGYTMYTELLSHFGYGFSWAGENLAMNNFGDHESPERALITLMNSPTHRSNILEGVFGRVGIGEVTHPDGRKIYTMIFLSW